MTPEQKLDKAAQECGWTSWAEVISHNAPAHVINRVVMLAMGEVYTLNTERIELPQKPQSRQTACG